MGSNLKRDYTGFNVLAFCFPGHRTAGDVATGVRVRQEEADNRIVADAVVEVDYEGKTHIHEPGKGGVGTAAGAVVGGVLGLIGGPAGLLAWTVSGAVIGGVAGHYLGQAIPKKDLEAFGEQLAPDSSAYLALVEEADTENIISDMAAYDANVITLTMGDDISGEIAEIRRETD